MSSSSTLRNQVLAIRRSLSEGESARMSAEACANFLRVAEIHLSKDFWKEKSVGIYRTRFSALPGELDPLSLEPVLISKGAKLYFPRVEEFGILEFAPATHDDHWHTGAYGLQEPSSHCSAISPEKLDLIFVPGVVFGRSGERMGLGKGYYDRYLARAPQADRVSLVFDFQLVNQLEQNSWDQPVHWIVTPSESRCLKEFSA